MYSEQSTLSDLLDLDFPAAVSGVANPTANVAVSQNTEQNGAGFFPESFAALPEMIHQPKFWGAEEKLAVMASVAIGVPLGVLIGFMTRACSL